jgi:PKD repeat protein
MVVALGLSTAACVASTDSHDAATQSRLSGTPLAKAVARSGGLTVTVTAPTRSRVGSPVEFNATAYERHALGAVGYRLRYGDGDATPPIMLPQFCTNTSRPVHETWRLSHRYKSPGRYTASLTVYVNCTGNHATATATVTVL